jgi:hypothetical protein
MQVNESIVVQDLCVVRGDETHAAHVSSQGVHLINTMCDLKAAFPPPQIKQQKLISIRGAKLGIF